MSIDTSNGAELTVTDMELLAQGIRTDPAPPNTGWVALITTALLLEALAKTKEDLARITETTGTIEALRERIEIQQGEISNLRRQQKR